MNQNITNWINSNYTEESKNQPNNDTETKKNDDDVSQDEKNDKNQTTVATLLRTDFKPDLPNNENLPLQSTTGGKPQFEVNFHIFLPEYRVLRPLFLHPDGSYESFPLRY